MFLGLQMNRMKMICNLKNLQAIFFQVYRLVSWKNRLNSDYVFFLSSKIHLISSSWCPISIPCITEVLSFNLGQF